MIDYQKILVKCHLDPLTDGEKYVTSVFSLSNRLLTTRRWIEITLNFNFVELAELSE